MAQVAVLDFEPELERAAALPIAEYSNIAS